MYLSTMSFQYGQSCAQPSHISSSAGTPFCCRTPARRFDSSTCGSSRPVAMMISVCRSGARKRSSFRFGRKASGFTKYASPPRSPSSHRAVSYAPDMPTALRAIPGRRRRAAPYRDRGPDSTTCGTRASRRSPRTGARLTNELPGDVGVVPPFHFGRLVALELLVGREEGLDLAKPVLSEVAQGSHLVEPRIADRYAEYFFVVAMLVAHEQRADRTRWHDATREGRLFDNDQRVQRVAVPTDGVHDEAVIGGIVHRREQDTVETNASGRLIELVFGARASRDLYEDVNALILAPAPHAPAPPRSWPAPRPP